MRTDTKIYKAMCQIKDRGYTITKDGRVLRSDGKPKYTRLNQDGYWVFNTYIKPKRRQVVIPVHQFQAFMNTTKEDWEKAQCSRHLDGNKNNNSADNIRLGTHRQNHFDKTEEQRQEHVEKMMKAHRLFTPDDWRQIIKRNDNGETVKQIADSLNKKYHQIGNGIRYWRGKR